MCLRLEPATFPTLTWCWHRQDPSDSGILAVVGIDGYLQRPNTCPDRAVPPDDEELSHTHTLVREKKTTRIYIL